MEMKNCLIDIHKNGEHTSIIEKSREDGMNVYRKIQRDIMKRAKSIIDGTFCPTPRVPKIKRSKWSNENFNHSSLNIKSPKMFRLNTLLDYNRMNSQKQPESYENGRENLRKLKVEIPLFKIPHSTTPYTSANSRIMDECSHKDSIRKYQDYKDNHYRSEFIYNNKFLRKENSMQKERVNNFCEDQSLRKRQINSTLMKIDFTTKISRGLCTANRKFHKIPRIKPRNDLITSKDNNSIEGLEILSIVPSTKKKLNFWPNKNSLIFSNKNESDERSSNATSVHAHKREILFNKESFQSKDADGSIANTEAETGYAFEREDSFHMMHNIFKFVG